MFLEKGHHMASITPSAPVPNKPVGRTVLCIRLIKDLIIISPVITMYQLFHASEALSFTEERAKGTK